VTLRGAERLNGHAAFLNWLTAPDSFRYVNAVYLAPRSIDWGAFVEPLSRLGYQLQVASRKADIATCNVAKRGVIDYDTDGKPIFGRSFLGRHTAGITDVDPQTSPEDQCAQALYQLEHLDELISSKWPARLGTSLASTGIAIFRSMLERPIGCSAHISAQLRADRAIGGGRAETFCPTGSTFKPSEYQAEGGEMIQSYENGPWEIDIRSAYMSAMLAGNIPAEYACDGPASSWHQHGSIVTALVDVPESEFPPLRYETINGACSFPYGRFIGTWPSVELRAAVECGVKILAVLQVRRFVIRDEFSRFAEALIELRGNESKYVQKAAKGIAVQTVGCWSARPSLYRTHAGAWTDTPEGVIQVRPFVYQVPRDAPRFSDREILPANITIIGTVRAWIASLLPALKSHGCRPIWVHTDGGAAIGNPRKAIENLLTKDAQKATLYTLAQMGLEKSNHSPDKHEQERRFFSSVSPPVGLPSPNLWKVYPVAKTEVFSATQRISMDTEGDEHVAAGGISRNLEPDEIRRLMRQERGKDGRHWVSKRPIVHTTGWTRAPHVRELDKQHSNAITKTWGKP
jgi:hypothetical protein